MLRNIKKTAFILLLFCGIAGFVLKADNFKVVAQSGCNYTVGNGEQFTTLGEALSQPGVSWAGKTVCIRNNKTYGKSGISVGGTANSPLTIKSHPQNSGRPEFRNNDAYSGETQDDAALTVAANHVVVEGIEIAKSPGVGIRVGTSHVRLENVVAHHTCNSGIKINKTNVLLQDVTVDGCEIYMATLAGSSACTSDSARDSVSEQLHVRDASDVIVQNCRIHNSNSVRGGTIGLHQAHHVTVRNNEVYDAEGNMSHLDQTHDILITNNVFYDTCTEQNRSNGFYKLDEKPDQLPLSTNITIKNNLIVGAKGGITVGNCKEERVSAALCKLNNWEIANNTVVGIMEDHALKLTAHTGASTDVDIHHNIFHRTGANSNKKTDLNQLGNVVSFANNIWEFKENPVASDQVIDGLANVFQSGLNPETCVTSPLNVQNYRVKSQYAGIGADVSTLGVQSETPPITPGPTSTPSPSNTPGTSPTSPDEPEDWDLNNNGVVNLYDFNIFIRRILNGNQDWSNVSQFIEAFRAESE